MKRAENTGKDQLRSIRIPGEKKTPRKENDSRNNRRQFCREGERHAAPESHSSLQQKERERTQACCFDTSGHHKGTDAHTGVLRGQTMFTADETRTGCAQVSWLLTPRTGSRPGEGRVEA